MFDVHKMLAVAVYSLLLSIISYKYNNAYYGSVSLIASLEREDTTVPDLPHIVPATVVAIDSENITETEMIIEISQEDSKTSELIGEKDKQKFEEPKEEPGTETETKASEPEEEERRKQEQPEKEPKEEEQLEEEPKEESNDDSLDGVPSELPTEGPKEEPRKDEEKQEQPEKEPKEESNDDSLDGVPSELPTEGPREKTKTETKDSEHEEKEEDQKQQEQPEEEPKEEEEHQEEKSKEEKPEERKPEEQQETTLINVIHKELDKTLYKEAVLITSLVAILVTFMVVIPCDDEEEQQITEIARLKEAIAKLEAEKNKQSADFKQRESEIQADIMETKKLREENERLPAEKKELSKCDVNKQKLVKLKDIAQERKRLLQDERCKLFCVHRAVLGLGVIECVSAYQSEGEFDDTAEDMKDVHTKLMPAHGPEQEFLEKLENVKKMDMEKMTFEDVNSVIEWLPDDYSVTKDKTKLTPKASKAVSKDYAEMVNSALRELWDKYCVAGKPSMNGLVEGLKAAGGICWAQENIKDIEKQARILQAALDAIYDSSALKHGLQLIHTVVSKALGLGEGECIRYSSVPSVLGLLLLQEGDEKDEEEENGGIKVFVKDVVRGKLKEDETEELKALKKTVEGAFGCDVSLLVARYQQVQHALMSAIDGVKRMTSEETKKTLHEAMTEVNNALESVRRYLVKTTNSPFDFGGITNKLVAICGKYGESKLDKYNTAEAIVVHTFNIIEALTQQ